MTNTTGEINSQSKQDITVLPTKLKKKKNRGAVVTTVTHTPSALLLFFILYANAGSARET